MNKKKRVVYGIIALFTVALFAAFYGYKEFNRKNKNVTEMKPAFSMTVAALVNAFETDEPAALKQYAGKVLEMEGMVKNMESNESGPEILVMGDSIGTTSVRVEMDSSQHEIAVKMQPGKKATLRAICTGFSADEFGLGADVLFNRGVVIKN